MRCLKGPATKRNLKMTDPKEEGTEVLRDVFFHPLNKVSRHLSGSVLGIEVIALAFVYSRRQTVT